MSGRYSKSLFGALTICWMCFILTVSIAVPLVFRGFYYMQIDSLNLVEETGYSKEEIVEAFDDMMDFCLFGGEFSTGTLKWSEDGKSHFEDVAKLFRLDFIVLFISGSGILIGYYLKKKKNILPMPFYGYGPKYWGSILLGNVFIIIDLIWARKYIAAFTIFHQIFFPGKTNWLFNPKTDEIINILPEEFFMNCAILIVVVMVIFCAAMIIIERRQYKKLLEGSTND